MSENPLETPRRSLEKEGGDIAEKDDCPTMGSSTICLSIIYLSVHFISLYVCVVIHLHSYSNVPLSYSLKYKRLRR